MDFSQTPYAEPSWRPAWWRNLTPEMQDNIDRVTCGIAQARGLGFEEAFDYLVPAIRRDLRGLPERRELRLA